MQNLTIITTNTTLQAVGGSDSLSARTPHTGHMRSDSARITLRCAHADPETSQTPDTRASFAAVLSPVASRGSMVDGSEAKKQHINIIENFIRNLSVMLDVTQKE